VGADKTYDIKDFVTAARALNVTPHVTKNDKGRRSNMVIRLAIEIVTVGCH